MEMDGNHRQPVAASDAVESLMTDIKKRLTNAFCAHPASVGETYFEHLGSAVRFSGLMLYGGAACFIHALLPFLFTSTGSRTIAQLHERMIKNRSKIAADNQSVAAESGE
jgi:hypothetical protein